MTNNSGWQRRSDDWVKMLEQSRLHKEKHLANKQGTTEYQIKKKNENHVQKPIDTS